MKAIVLVCLFAITTARILPSELDEHWKNFKTKFNKNYESNEEIARRLIWEQNVMSVMKHNLNYDLGLFSYNLGINEYSDLTLEEFSQQMNGFKSDLNRTSKSEYTFLRLSHVLLPDTVDWRKEGYVTEVKNQKHCGSCWAFSSTGALEGQHKRKTGKLVSLSEQNLVDCSQEEGNAGCKGGIMDEAFTYVKDNKGIDTEKSYPYEAIDGKCRFNPKSIGATCTGFVDILSGDEEALKHAVATIGPISVSIDGSTFAFQFYRGGILDDRFCGNTIRDLDHGILVVGYGTEDGVDYWLAKNSYGPNWGMNGYIKMSRNKENQCGIATAASYPLM